MDLSEIIVPDGLVPKSVVTCVIEGILEESDLRELTLGVDTPLVPGDEVEDPSDLKRVKEKHHSVARMIAGGLTQRMVAQLCGYQESYLSILLNNPAMQELIELYSIQNGGGAALITEKLRTVGLKALEKLEEKVDGGQMNANELIQASKLGLDRGGHGPSSTQHNISETHLFDHTELARRNQDARTRSASRIVPASQIRALSAPSEQEDESSGEVGQERPVVHENGSQSGLPEHRE
jgi:hypothetical protein